MPDHDRAEILAHLATLRTDDLRFLLQLATAFGDYVGQMQAATQMVANRQRTNQSDSDEQWLQQAEAIHRETLLQRVNVAPDIRRISRRLQEAFELRRNGRLDPLLQPAKHKGAHQPTIAELRFRSFMVRAAIALHAAQPPVSLENAFAAVARRMQWINKNPEWRIRLGGAPSISALRGWYEGRNADTRFGRFYAQPVRDLPPGTVRYRAGGVAAGRVSAVTR